MDSESDGIFLCVSHPQVRLAYIIIELYTFITLLFNLMVLYWLAQCETIRADIVLSSPRSSWLTFAPCTSK